MLTDESVEPVDLDYARHRLWALKAELRRRRWLDHPDEWAKERLGIHLWSKQVEILKAIIAHRKVAVASCHEIGKSFIAAVACCFWGDVHLPGEAFIVTTAPTGPQVEAILWREIGRVHALGPLGGRLNTTQWKMVMSDGREELIGFGRKPADYDPTAFQGIHARYVLFVGDEACGLPQELLEAADSLTANDLSKTLLIGNPDIPGTPFEEACKPGSGYHVIHVSAFDSPNFSGEPIPDRLHDLLIGKTYVEEKRRKWAPQWFWADVQGNRTTIERGVRCLPPENDPSGTDTNPLWQSKILGRFPENNLEGTLIPVSWIIKAQQRTLVEEGSGKLGVDVGGGGDSSTICKRRGGVARVIHEDHNPDTMHTCGVVVATSKAHGIADVNIDSIGIGRGVADRSKELAKEDVISKAFNPINVGDAPRGKDADETFLNYKAELNWYVRTQFELGLIDIDPADDDLAGELAQIKFKRTSNGKIQIESKEDAKRRGVPSPNRADALMLSYAVPKKRYSSATF